MDEDVFTDDVLDRDRTTRCDVDPFRDGHTTIVRGDLILVDVAGYKLAGGLEWCEFVFDSPGSAAVFPYKAWVPGAGVGQWKAAEIHAWARPVRVHRRLAEFRAVASSR